MFQFAIHVMRWLMVGICAMAPAIAIAEVRNWAIRDRATKIEAELVELLEPNFHETNDGGRPKKTSIPPQVTLRILNGNKIKVWLRDLSDEDQLFVREEIANRLKAEQERNEPFARAIVGRWVQSDTELSSPKYMLRIFQSGTVPARYEVQYIRFPSPTGEQMEILWRATGEAHDGVLKVIEVGSRMRQQSSLSKSIDRGIRRVLERDTGLRLPPPALLTKWRYQHEFKPEVNADGIATDLEKRTTNLLVPSQKPNVSRFVREIIKPVEPSP